MSFLLWILAVVLVVVGLVGIVMPAVPGHLLILIGLVVGAWADGFTRVGFWTLAIIATIGLASYGIDFAAAAMGVRRLGATPRAMTGAFSPPWCFSHQHPRFAMTSSAYVSGAHRLPRHGGRTRPEAAG
jgi:uncharacterized protein YqgC (DUF456 family)